MKIAIIGASGKAGALLAEEALIQGYDVTAIVRDRTKIKNSKINVIEKSIFDLTPTDIKIFDVVIDAFNAPSGEENQHATSMTHLISIFESVPDTRLLVVGGAGSLYVDPDQRIALMDSDGFPAEYKAIAVNMAKGLEALKASHINWTYLSPAAFFDPAGKRTGQYVLGSENLHFNSAKQSYVSYADYALAMIDEIKIKAYVKKRFSVVSES